MTKKTTPSQLPMDSTSRELATNNATYELLIAQRQPNNLTVPQLPMATMSRERASNDVDRDAVMTRLNSSAFFNINQENRNELTASANGLNNR